MLANASVQQEDGTVTSICAPHVRPSKYAKPKLRELKGNTDCSTIMVAESSTSLRVMGRTTRRKISEEIQDFSSTVNQVHQTHTHTQHGTRQQQHTHSPQVHVEHSPGEVIDTATD